MFVLRFWAVTLAFWPTIERHFVSESEVGAGTKVTTTTAKS